MKTRKTLLILLISILFITSCSKEDVKENGCLCNKETFRQSFGTSGGYNSPITTTMNKSRISYERGIPCEPEGTFSISSNVYSVVTCQYY